MSQPNRPASSRSDLPPGAAPSPDAAAQPPLLTTSGIFVIHLRSDSDLARRQLCGRIEHVMSGQSEPFVGLSDMLAFMARYPLAPPAPATNMAAREREGPIPVRVDQQDQD